MALDFVQASEQYVGFGDSDDFTPVLGDGFYCCGWFEFDNLTSLYRGLFIKYDPSSEWYFIYEGTNKRFLALIRDDGGEAYICRFGDDTFPLSIGTPYFCEFVYDGGTTDAAIKIYVNLTRWDTTNDGAGVFDNPLNGINPLRIANATLWGATNFFDGRAWDCRIYNRALSDSEREAIYYGRGSDNIVNGLVARWLMNEKPDGETAKATEWTRDGSNPILSATRGGLLKILKEDGTFYLFYCVGTTSPRPIYYATSATIDGSFTEIGDTGFSTEHGGFAILMDPADHTPIKMSENELGISADTTKKYWMFYSPASSEEINIATNTSLGGTWTAEPDFSPCLTIGDAGAWDDYFVGNDGLAVFKDGSTYYMIYEGCRSDYIYKAGLATSPNLVDWTKSGSNPVHSPAGDERTITPCDIWKDDSVYIMLVNAQNNADNTYENLAIATSTDLINWARKAYPMFKGGVGSETGNVSDFGIYRTGTKDYLFYEAGSPISIWRAWCDNILNLPIYGKSILDISGRGNHGTPANSPVYRAAPVRLVRPDLIMVRANTFTEMLTKKLGFVPTHTSKTYGILLKRLGLVPSRSSTTYGALFKKLGFVSFHSSTIFGSHILKLGFAPSHISIIYGILLKKIGLIPIHEAKVYKFIVELKFYDRDDNLVKIISSKTQNFPLISPGLEFEFLQDGGCGFFGFTASEDLSLDYNYKCEIYIYEDKWFTGYITKLPKIGTKTTYEYRGWGYFEQIDWQTIKETYTGDELSVIAEDILDTYIVPYTDVKKGT